ncbi:MAG TPA: sugar phosphate isomerase/epimerase family protein [Abditibacteriaceae bacterium]|jgi:sugar phosphate isomerase/epimerase
MIQYLSGFADEAGAALETQIRATQQLGWHHIEMRNVLVSGFPGGNLHDISDEAFVAVTEQLQAANIRVNCFGTAMGKDADNFEYDLRAAKNIARRAAEVGASLARIMSYPINSLPEGEVFRRLREITQILADGGVQPVVENCYSYAAMSPVHAQRLIENVPGAAIVFDPGNCVGFPDYSQPEPYPQQSAWEFYKAIRPYIVHFHVKDARWDEKKIHTFPGEGEADIERILADLVTSGYDGGISIEPHLENTGLSDDSLSHDERCFESYIEYGRRLEKLLAEIPSVD